MFKSISDRYPNDADYPARTRRQIVLAAVLTGTLYDILPHDFHTERNEAGEYIPLRDRRPSVRYGLCRTVVDDSVSLLFSEGHFPSVVCADEATRDALSKIAREAKLNEVMIDGATKGSVGSVMFKMRVLGNRVFFSAHTTEYLTPTWKPEAPDTLAKVTEKYKVRGRVLADQGYVIGDDDLTADFWFQREWGDVEETWFTPWKVSDKDATPSRDERRTTKHSLGFVPLVWVRNMPGGDDTDGGCTFSGAIDTNIEIDYQLSQAGRGLKYSADPTLLIKEPAFNDKKERTHGAANALVVSAEGDAKLLEIDGTASQAVIEYVRCLRELALESIHGNRANADKISAAQSGRAMELMNQALIWLADRLRISYGEGALLDLLCMVIRARQKFSLLDKRGKAYPEFNATDDISLRWPAWYPPTYADRQTESQTLSELTESHLLSRETATATIAKSYDIDDPKEELRRIAAEPPLESGGDAKPRMQPLSQSDDN